MDINIVINKIINNEEEYMKNFCTIHKFENYTRYEDEGLKDMYDYNCILINKTNDPKQAYEIIESEKKYRKEINSTFCRVFMEDKPQLEYFDESYKDIEIEHNGYYLYESMKKPDWKVLDNCEVRKTDDQSLSESLLEDSLIHYDCNNDDFRIRRAKHHNAVYIDKEKPLNCYVCYYDNKPVGRCELMIKDGIAKIEDFMVLEQYQRRGIGTTIMNYLLNEALNKDVDYIYLVADEDDTPKEMYMNMGFKKVYDRFGIIINL